ncbi:FtsW/RodA/SpoVE family cell cycle protein [Trueperella sp. LYQ143]|uniref:FtsW/RodA/SpoVE family cell cycle protein n=1 Tax=unclassified Trueperella TaxID=2630174 RepID=UPI003982E9A3
MSVVTQQRARTGRLREIGLLVIALVICAIAWILVYHAETEHATSPVPPRFALIMALVVIAVCIAHIFIRRWAPWADPTFFPIAVALTGLGLVMIHRIDFALVARGGAPELTGQARLAVLGLILMVATVGILRDHRRLRRVTYLSLIGGTFLLLMPMIPGLGRTINGARIWIHFAGFSYQPAEMAKILFAIFFAGYLVVQRDNLALAGKKFFRIQLPRARHFAPLLVAWIACMGILMMERDFGTAILFFALFIALLYIATERISWIIFGGLLTIVGVYAIVQIMPHIQARFEIWQHPLDPDIYNSAFGSYQLVQGWFGMASGGMVGTGFGQGYPTNSFAANSDFIIASFGEEIGLIGLLAILAIFLLFVSRAFKVAIDLRDGFGKLLASGLGFVIAVQCFVVVGGVTGVIPLTGLAMPFLALGGSALLTNWIIVGLLLRMSDAARRPYTPTAPPVSSGDSGDLTLTDPATAPSPEEADRQPTVVVSR